jgi:hypothetical protein
MGIGVNEEVTMLERLRGALRFANVTSVLALVVAMGGGAYAMTTIGAAGRVIHGCYTQKTGNLRVIKAGKKCRKSERAIAWNQTGPMGQQGLQGSQGIQGIQGIQGPQGPSAASFTAMQAGGTNQGLVATASNGVRLLATCQTMGNGLTLWLAPASNGGSLEFSGAKSFDTNAPAVADGQGLTGQTGSFQADWDVIAADPNVGKFARIDFHGTQNGGTSVCTYWGMIIPSS